MSAPLCPLCNELMQTVEDSALWEHQCGSCLVFSATPTAHCWARKVSPVLALTFWHGAANRIEHHASEDIEDLGLGVISKMKIPSSSVKDALSPEWWDRIMKLKAFL